MDTDITKLTNLKGKLKDPNDIEKLNMLINRAYEIIMDTSINTYTKNVELSNIVSFASLLEKKNKMSIDNCKLDQMGATNKKVEPIKVSFVSNNSSNKQRLDELERQAIKENEGDTNNA